MPSISVRRLYQDNVKKLDLVWVAGSSGTDNRIHADQQRPTLALVGHVNLIHPNSIQVFGLAEIQYLNGLGETDAEYFADAPVTSSAGPLTVIALANPATVTVHMP